MKILLLLLFPLYSFAQIEGIADFKKYSYQMYGVFEARDFKIIQGGTCFFLRKNDKLFLITAKHVVVGCEDGTYKKLDSYPDTMYIALTENIDETFRLITTDIKDTANCPELFIDPDILVIPIVDSITHIVNSIENFIKPPFEYTGTLSVTGFPGSHLTPMREIKLKQRRLLHWGNGEYQWTPVNNKKSENTSWFIRQNIYQDEAELDGFSGSPLFVQDSLSKQWRVAGAFSSSFEGASDQKDNIIQIARIEHAIAWINQYLRRKESK